MKQKKPRTKERKPRKLFKRLMLMLMIVAAAEVSVSGGAYSTYAEMAQEVAPMVQRKGRTVMYIMDAHNLKLRDEDAAKTVAEQIVIR